jgi:hypothetical protein
MTVHDCAGFADMICPSMGLICVFAVWNSTTISVIIVVKNMVVPLNGYWMEIYNNYGYLY